MVNEDDVLVLDDPKKDDITLHWSEATNKNNLLTLGYKGHSV